MLISAEIMKLYERFTLNNIMCSKSDFIVIVNFKILFCKVKYLFILRYYFNNEIEHSELQSYYKNYHKLASVMIVDR